MKKHSLVFRIVFYGILLSSLIGTISFIFMFLQGNIAHLLWGKLQSNTFFKTGFIFIFCLIGGVVVGKLKDTWGNYPKTAHYAIDHLKKNQTLNYQPVFKNLLAALLILVFGAGVGPEAALLSTLVMLSVWQADKMRYLFFHQVDFVSLSPINRITHMLHPTKYLVTYNPNLAPKDKNFISTKKAMNIFFIVNGIVSFTILMKLTKQPSFISNMGNSSWHLKDLWIFLPLIVLGILAGKTYNIFKTKMSTLFSFWPNKPIQKALIGSITIFIVGAFMPNLLFSGEATLGSVPSEYVKYSTLILFLVVIIKLVFLQVCLNTGWIGGDIFPITFSAILFGFAVSQLLPFFDITFVVATVATAMAVTILNSPIGIGIFIALFFPIQLFPVILTTALLLKLAKGYLKKQGARRN